MPAAKVKTLNRKTKKAVARKKAAKKVVRTKGAGKQKKVTKKSAALKKAVAAKKKSVATPVKKVSGKAVVRGKVAVKPARNAKRPVAGGKNARLTRQEQNRYKKILLEKRQALAVGLDTMEDETLLQSGSGNISTVPIHPADIGSENYQQEFMLQRIESQKDELDTIDDALYRIEQGSYGICECGKRIQKSRLDAIPEAGLCIECAKTHGQ